MKTPGLCPTRSARYKPRMSQMTVVSENTGLRDMIDLHTHTSQSDGTLSPAELVEKAERMGLEALAITDHDTFEGYDRSLTYSELLSIELVCGVELSATHRGRSVHVLAYFLNGEPPSEFRSWIAAIALTRHRRNCEIVEKLRLKGLTLTMDEVSGRAGAIVARPHFAALMVEKGYVTSIQQAFDEYLDESASCFAERIEPPIDEALSKIITAGGLSVLSHPSRLKWTSSSLEAELTAMRGMGLRGLEVYHSEHSAHNCAAYESLARKLGLAVTGGSDFHGELRPQVALGSGIGGNLNIPRSILDDLRAIG